MAMVWAGAAWALTPKPADGPPGAGAWLPLALLAFATLPVLVLADPGQAKRRLRASLFRLAPIGAATTLVLGLAFILRDYVPLLPFPWKVPSGPDFIIAAEGATRFLLLPAVAAGALWLAERFTRAAGVPAGEGKARPTTFRTALRLLTGTPLVMALAILTVSLAGNLAGTGNWRDEFIFGLAAGAGLLPTLLLGRWRPTGLVPWRSRLCLPVLLPAWPGLRWGMAALLPVLPAVALSAWLAGANRALEPIPAGITAVAVLPDDAAGAGRGLLALGGADGVIRLYDRRVSGGTPVLRIDTGDGASAGAGAAPGAPLSAAITALALRQRRDQDPDSPVVLASARADGVVGLFDARTGAAQPLPPTLAAFPDPASRVWVGLGPGAIPVVGGEAADGAARLIAPAGATTLSGSGPITALAAAAKSDLLAVATLDGQVRWVRLRADAAPALLPPPAPILRLPAPARQLTETGGPDGVRALGDDGTIAWLPPPPVSESPTAVVPTARPPVRDLRLSLGAARTWTKRITVVPPPDTVASLSPSPAGTRTNGTASVPRHGTVLRDCADCPELVVLPRGSFMMGSPDSELERSSDEGPQHRVTIDYDLAVGKYEVTFSEWDACVAQGGCGVYRPEDRGWGRGRRPVIKVSWNDAQSYVQWLSHKTGQTYRLPSESEWEYAARGGTKTPFWAGKTITTDQANFNGDFTYNGSRKGVYRGKTVDVGSFRANPFGLHDVYGNVWEWVEDCWNDSYNGVTGNGSVRTDGNCFIRVLRGGSWYNGPNLVRSANRGRYVVVYRVVNNGFRVARTFF